jgi:hypothetical protein
VRLFLSSCKHVSFVIDAKLEGMVPVKLLLPRARVVSSVSNAKFEGMVPVKPLQQRVWPKKTHHDPSAMPSSGGWCRSSLQQVPKRVPPEIQTVKLRQ